MNSYINTASDCTVKQFEECAFKQKYRVLVLEGDPSAEELQQAFELIYAQYVDLSGLFVSREFDLSAYIHSLEVRTTTVKNFVELQKLFIKEFGQPFPPAFRLVKRYGHTLYWNAESPNLELFIQKLNKIPSKEVRYEIELKNKKTELVELHRKRIKKEFTLQETRSQFVTMINRLRQSHFVINRNETTVEELALAIADQREQQEAANAQRQFKRR
ncbi:MAG TPA: hypothetical protein VGN00_14300 [Puia sp.]|jgi:hypothetical protein